MKTTVIVAATLLLFSCSDNTQTKSKNTIAEVYNAQVNKENLTRENKEEYIKITVSNSSMIDTLHPNISSANIALLAYQEMSSDEKSAIKTIDIELITQENKNAGYTYQVDFMKGVEEKSDVFNELSSAIVNKDFKLLDQKRNAQEIPNAIEETMKQKLKFLEKNYGKLKGYTTFGLAEQNSSVGSAYQFQAYLNFEKRDVPYFFHLFTEQGKDEWVGFSIKN
ncbi:MAG: hypothetical protein WDZ45_06170 [Flavobacteriaceae bacterium]